MSKKRSKNERRERRRYQVEPLESRLVLASDWTNPIDVFNVDGTNETVESVTPLDALLVINELNDRTVSDVDGRLPELTENDEDTSVYFDVNGDGFVSPLDAVMVVNKLNENQEPVSEVSKYAAAGVIAGSRAADHDAITEDTLVNTQTRFVQRRPSVASAPNGSSVIVWESFGNDGSGWGVFGQRFDASGAAVGSEFQVNTTTLGAQTAPNVAVGDDGRFVVVWQSVFGSDGNGFGVYSQEYDSAGSRVGGETQVNTTRIGTQFHPEVACGGAG